MTIKKFFVQFGVTAVIRKYFLRVMFKPVEAKVFLQRPSKRKHGCLHSSALKNGLRSIKRTKKQANAFNILLVRRDSNLQWQ